MAVQVSLKSSANVVLQPALQRLVEIIEEENTVLQRHRVVSHAGFTDRKNHALRDLMATQRHEASGSALSFCKPLLTRLSAALKVNGTLLKLHISAVGEVSDIIINSMREADSDGTYSRGPGPSRRA